jgi:peroxiredoxin
MDAVAEVGEKAPLFSLDSLTGGEYSLERSKGKVVVLTFWSAECPWSRKADEYIKSQGYSAEWGDEVVHWRIASNANETEAELKEAAAERQVEPVLLDTNNEVADLYGAMTTPHVYVVDSQGVLRYAGALNDATWREPEPTKDYLGEAVTAAKKGLSPEPAETPGRGCTIVRYKLD